MEIAFRLLVVGLFGAIVGLIGGMVMIKLIDRGNVYLFDHPPNPEKKNKKGDTKND